MEEVTVTRAIALCDEENATGRARRVVAEIGHMAGKVASGMVAAYPGEVPGDGLRIVVSVEPFVEIDTRR